ncbi:hypothetical protein PUNSTDRAFT_104486 [Punctularia strigosozonata HHB-11173 SS5]|uniref:uncharacterized protein n=1 Tax=Punctularia strigosozonata (strain HHB-11173) TaxID=741275 RepID=UPI0004417FCC|nr:uncharacterized protein PUNSTDRAFT_104486 [Punctularia strigosozonata HHB-11173 SS5]EIN07038.1 hypothetical protein PUNSTDRAFT_104486 [Punctularia strigosozonata HHB-11173 SS5]
MSSATVSPELINLLKQLDLNVDAMEPFKREELVDALNCMNVNVKANTKLPMKSLEHLLGLSLEAAQRVPRLLKDGTPLDPSGLGPWQGRDLIDAVNIGNLHEAFQNARRGSRDVELYKDVFMDLRQTVMAVGKGCDDGRTCFVIQPRDEKEQEAAINLRVVSTHVLSEKTPIIVVLYRIITLSNAQEGFQWLEKRHVQCEIVNTFCTPAEQKLVKLLLQRNSKLISPDFKPSRLSGEDNFSVSCVLPIGPLDFADVARLNADELKGCIVCGKQTLKECSRCRSAKYCGPECQKSHWREHKPVCRSIEGGEWRRFIMAPAPADAKPGMRVVTLNRFSSPGDTDPSSTAEVGDSPGPNIHGDRPFIAKIQKGNPIQCMLVYDQQRSFQGFIPRGGQEMEYGELMEQMKTGWNGIKVYRWAKRAADKELMVCLNRGPSEFPPW